MDSDIKHKEYFQVYDKGDNKYYVELNKIQIRELSNIPFVGEAIYKYDSDKEDFIIISKYWNDKEYKGVMERLQLTVKDFCDRNNIK